jgi:hypothetical protein
LFNRSFGDEGDAQILELRNLVNVCLIVFAKRREDLLFTHALLQIHKHQSAFGTDDRRVLERVAIVA